MRGFYLLLLFGGLAAVLLFAVIIPTAEEFPRYANLNLAPIPVQSDSTLSGNNEKLERCSSRISPSGNQTLEPLLDGTGIFQDLDLNQISQAQPLYRWPTAQLPSSPQATNQTACTFSVLQTSG